MFDVFNFILASSKVTVFFAINLPNIVKVPNVISMGICQHCTSKGEATHFQFLYVLILLRGFM